MNDTATTHCSEQTLSLKHKTDNAPVSMYGKLHIDKCPSHNDSAIVLFL